MSEPWDRPPFPKRGNKSQDILFESIGRALMAWEEIETALAHLYSMFFCGSQFNEAANREYGIPQNFVSRLQGLEKMACRYFYKNPSQSREGAFAEIMRFATGYSLRRNDIAHGRARPIQWILNPSSKESLLSLAGRMQWCVIPAHFKGDKFTQDNKPAYVFTSREMNHFSEAFWDITRQDSDLTHEIEVQAPA